MQDESTLIHREHVSARSFDEVVSTFKDAIGHIEGDKFAKAVQASATSDEFEKQMHTAEGSSGFMLFQELDHGAWMARIGLNVPVRVLIYEKPRSGSSHLAYDLPSSLMAPLKNEQFAAAVKQLDDKLSALATTATGASA